MSLEGWAGLLNVCFCSRGSVCNEENKASYLTIANGGQCGFGMSAGPGYSPRFTVDSSHHGKRRKTGILLNVFMKLHYDDISALLIMRKI